MNQPKTTNRPSPVVTRAQALIKLKSLGVVFEETTKPFTKDSKNTSLMGNYNKRIVMK